MTCSVRCLEIIKEFEGWRGRLYNDIAGNATIGYGHLVHMGKINGTEPEEFKRGITPDRGEEILCQDAANRAECHVDRLVTVGLTQNQYDALVSFVFNIGGEAFEKSHLLSKLNASNAVGAADEFNRWTHANGEIVADLVIRRRKERALFIDPTIYVEQT